MSVFLIRSSLCSIYYFILVQMSGYVNLISKKICITMSPASFPTIKMSRRHTYFMLIVSTGKKEYHIIDIMWFFCFPGLPLNLQDCHPFQLPLVDFSGARCVDPCYIQAAVSQNVRQPCHIFGCLIIYPCKQMSQIVRKNFFTAYIGFFF